MTLLTCPIDVEKLIPHRLPMRLVDTLLNCGDDRSGIAEATLRENSIVLDEDGTLNKAALVEMMAQTYAAVKGFEDINASKPVQQGFLVGIRKAKFHAAPQRGERLTIAVSTIGAMDGFYLAAGTVRCGETVLAEASLKLWVPDETEGRES